jgi:predicted PurR-regulated permease PerM
MNRDTEVERSFQKKVWTATGIVALVVVVLLLLKAIFNVLLLVFFAVLISVYFHSLKRLINDKTRLSEKASLGVSIGGSILLLAGFFWLAGDQISTQSEEIAREFPAMVEKVRADLEAHNLGQKLVDRVQKEGEGENMQQFIQRFFSGTFGVLGDLYIVIILTLFFTSDPRLYVNGILKMVPARSRKDADELLDRLAWTLGKWLKGMLVAMLFVAVLTAIGLFALSIRTALVLALLAGLLNFIPNFGPLIAAVPALLIASLEGPTIVLIVFALYVVTQVVESTVVQPQLQKKLIHMPPALIIIAQLTMGVFSGALGLILATPLIAVLMIVVEELHVKRQDEKAREEGLEVQPNT